MLFTSYTEWPQFQGKSSKAHDPFLVITCPVSTSLSDSIDSHTSLQWGYFCCSLESGKIYLVVVVLYRVLILCQCYRRGCLEEAVSMLLIRFDENLFPRFFFVSPTGIW